MKTLIVDHDTLARQDLAAILDQHRDISEVLEATNSVEALETLIQTPIQLMFLDPDLPLIDGFEFLSRSKEHPPVIMSSLRETDCYKAIQFGAVDFLLKPYQTQKVINCLSRLNFKISQLDQIRTETKPTLSKILCRTHNTHHVVWLQDVHHFNKDGRYTSVVNQKGQPFLTHLSLDYLENHLPSQNFCRINRGVILAKSAIKGFTTTASGNGQIHAEQGSHFTVSRNRLAQFRQWLDHT